MLPNVTIIIVNWNHCEMTLACLESVSRLDYPVQLLQVIVVDNDSMDGSVEAIQIAYPGVKVIVNTENLGYAGGNNSGIRWALEKGADLLLILNNDTVVDPAMLKRLATVLIEDQQVGIAGPLVYHADDPEMIQSAGGRLGSNWKAVHIGVNEMDISQFTDKRQVDWLSGCALLVRAEAIKQTGLFDERFFSYWEDLDLCLRMKKAGWMVVNVPYARLWHKGVQANYQPKPHVTYYMTRNQLLLMRKYSAPLHVWVGSLLGMMRLVVSWTVQPKWRMKRQHRNALLLGLVDFYRQRWGGAELKG